MFALLRRWFRQPRKRIGRERFLLPKEWELLRQTLEQYPLKVRIYFAILFLEGPRMSELRTVQWDDLDIKARLWHKATTKNGKRQLLPLSDCSCDLLNMMPRNGIYVFTGEIMKGGAIDRPWSRTAVKYWWRKIRWEAGCPDLRIHDIRRSTGSWLTIHGENLKIVQSVLGHSSLEVTGRSYAHLDLEAQRGALNRLAKYIFPVHNVPSN